MYIKNFQKENRLPLARERDKRKLKKKFYHQSYKYLDI